MVTEEAVMFSFIKSGLTPGAHITETQLSRKVDSSEIQVKIPFWAKSKTLSSYIIKYLPSNKENNALFYRIMGSAY